MQHSKLWRTIAPLRLKYLDDISGLARVFGVSMLTQNGQTQNFEIYWVLVKIRV